MCSMICREYLGRLTGCELSNRTRLYLIVLERITAVLPGRG